MAKLTAAQKAERVNRAPRSDKTDSLPVETRSPTVTIACKLPNGLHMDLKHPLTGEPHRVTVRGPLNARIVSNGFGMTSGVDRDFAEAWFKAYSKYHPVVTGQIFAEELKADAKAHARENRDVKTGLEAKDPNALPAKITVADGPKNGGGDDSGDDDDED
jgi:hypothetical protein